MKNRESLQVNSNIWLISIEDGNPHEFTILDTCGQGGSAICYRATKNNRKGILKEFYPLDSDIKQFAVNLSRKNHANSKLRGQLYSENTTIPNFINLRNIYYNSCQEIIAAKTDEEDLNNFIPRIEIFKSYVDDEKNDSNFTYYTWILEDTSMKSFDEIIKDIYIDIKNQENKSKNTLLILDCVLELAKSVCLLHLSGLFHLDLTPANFGVNTYRGSANKNVSISLYDVNTIYSQRFDNYISSGTPGFRSPEIEEGKQSEYSIKSDIYSIGAILYYAFVVDENYNNCFYDREGCGKKAFDMIAANLKGSVLLKSADESTNIFLYNNLLSIVKKALNIYGDPCGNFGKTEELIDELEQLINKFGIFVGKEEFESYGADWIETKTKTKEEHYNETVKTGATGAIQRLLYKYPLYDYKINDNDLNVLVLGCGTYSPKFIDIAFELSQIDHLRLNLTVACEEPDRDKKFYLNARPEFSNFISVDGNKDCERAENPYGFIEFKESHFNQDNSYNSVESLLNSKTYSYIFIALNDENLNKNMARACYKYLQDKDKTLISYIVYKKTDEEFSEKANGKIGMIPVCVTDTLIEQEEYEYLEQMALNVHLLWSTYGISDMQESVKEFFENEYNYNSSLKMALSIKYKLHSIGIAVDRNDPNQTAIDFKKEFSENEDLLIMYEQKRWNVGQITDGWRVMEETEFSSLINTTKDYVQMKHPIICDVSIDHPLDSWNKEKWDNATTEEINELDRLDQTSVYMYRHFKKMSGEVKKRSDVIKGRLLLLSKIVSKNARLLNLATFLMNVVNRILVEESSNVNLLSSYKYYRNSLRTVLDSEKRDEPDFDQAKKCLEQIDDDLFPIMQAGLYKSWKNNNVDLIRNIPFTLTYARDIHICMPMVLDSYRCNSNLFLNVASAMKINPKKITYIVDGDSVQNDKESFISSLEFISKIFDAHKIQAEIYIVMLKGQYADKNVINRDEIKSKFRRIVKFDFVDYGSISKPDVLKSLFIDNQSAYNQGNCFSALEYNNEGIGQLVKKANCLANDEKKNIIPAFYFDEKNQTFITDYECSWLNYIPHQPQLQVSDLFEDNRIEFFEPELSSRISLLSGILENRYALWCKLCDIISEQNKRNSKLANFNINKSEDQLDELCEFVFPSFCEDTVAKIVNLLIESNIISDESHMSYFTSKSTLLRAYNVSINNKLAFERLFANTARLHDPTLVYTKKIPNGLEIYSDERLDINNILIGDSFSAQDKEQCLCLLSELNQKYFIVGLKIDSVNGESKVSFSYPSVYEKSLMMDKKKLVQSVIHYKLLETELFCDVQSGIDISFDSTTYQIDAIATKNLQTVIFISDSGAADYNPTVILNKIAKKYGINSILVLFKTRNDDYLDSNKSKIHILSANDNFTKKLKSILK